MSFEQLSLQAVWAVAGAACVWFLARALWTKYKKGESAKPSLRHAAIAGLVAAVVIPAIGIVPAGTRGVIYQWNGGVNYQVRNEGITLLVPWVQHLRVFTVRTQKVFSSKIFAQSKDLQEITVVGSVNFHVDPDKAASLYDKVGPMYQETVIEPALFQRTKAAIGQIVAVDFAVQRDKLARTIQAQLTEQLAPYGIVVEYMNIEDAIFDPAFVKAVKEKVIAIQKAQEQQRLIAMKSAIKTQTIIDAQAEAVSTLTKARAQAKANDLLRESISPALVQWQWIATWNGIVPSTYVGSGQAPGLIFNLPTP